MFSVLGLPMKARYEHSERLIPLVSMKRIALFFGIAFLALPGFGQVEQTQWTFVDAERDDRQIPCEVWYPSDASSTLPAVVFAHGFVMGADDYTGLAQALATEGYAFVSIATEQGFMPDHEAYGQDLAFVAAQTRPMFRKQYALIAPIEPTIKQPGISAPGAFPNAAIPAERERTPAPITLLTVLITSLAILAPSFRSPGSSSPL